MSIRVEAIYGYERIVSYVLNGRLDDAFKLADILAGQLGLPNPYLSYQRFQILKSVLYSHLPLGIKFSSLKGIRINPPMTKTNAVLTYYREMLDTYLDFFEFLYNAARKVEDVYGVNITQLMTGQVLQPIIVSLSAVTTPPENTSPDLFMAMMISLIACLTGKEKKSAFETLKYALLEMAYKELSETGPIYRRPEFQSKSLYYSVIFNQTFDSARASLAEAIRSLEEVSTEKYIRYFYPKMITYSPFFIVDRNAWYSGAPQSSGTISLYKPNFPAVATEGKPHSGGIYSSTGSGKTTLLNSLTYYALVNGNFALRLEIDMRDAMTPQLFALPLNQNHPAYTTLRAEGLSPIGLGAENVISLMVVEKKSDLDMIPVKPTAVDRVLYVQSLDAFHLPWERIVAPKKIFAIRYTGDMRSTARIFRTIIESFRVWRMQNKQIPIFVGIDEAYAGAGNMPSYTFARALGMATESSVNLMMTARGLSISLFVATQRPKMLSAGIRTQISHIFAADVGEEKDIEIILERIPKSSKDRESVENLLQQSEIRSDPYHWFIWVNMLQAKIEVIRSAIAPVAAEMPNMSSWDQFNEAKLALESWNSVPTLFNDIGTPTRPLPIYEPFLPERERTKKRKTPTPEPAPSPDVETDRHDNNYEGEFI